MQLLSISGYSDQGRLITEPCSDKPIYNAEASCAPAASCVLAISPGYLAAAWMTTILLQMCINFDMASTEITLTQPLLSLISIPISAL